MKYVYIHMYIYMCVCVCVCVCSFFLNCLELAVRYAAIMQVFITTKAPPPVVWTPESAEAHCSL